jgi:acetyltransferase
MSNASGRSAAVRIRSIRSEDRDPLCRFYADLSEASRIARFHAVSHGIADDLARRLCGPDHEHREGLVAEAVTAEGAAEIVGHLCLEPTGRSLEVAIAVADSWQRRGIGRALLLAAVDWACAHGFDRLEASMVTTNSAILGLLRSIGGDVRLTSPRAGTVQATIRVVQPANPFRQRRRTLAISPAG